jgi:pimeloyl-ACP methyl ester carboxylesterase/uncharacterized protein YndB with AHSA1/START domain
MPHEFEVREEITLDATPEQVWAAIATGPGINSWFMGHSEIEGREGGRGRLTMGEYVGESTVTAWDPPHRLAYRGDASPDGTFMAFEYLVEGRGGGSTVLRFVHSGLLGDDWESEYDALSTGDRMYLRKLAAYLRHFPGRTATATMLVPGPAVADAQRVWTAVARALGLAGAPAEGDTVRIGVDGLTPTEGVVAFADLPNYVGVCTPDGLYVFMRGMGDTVIVEQHAFSDTVDQKETELAWQSWLGTLSEPAVERGYAPVNGLRMYYEIHGTGHPVVLLHGSLSAIGTSFGAVLPSLAQTRQVIAVEMQAHGRTADIDRPLRIESLAEDTVALLRHLGVHSADIFGYSLGAAVALRVAIDHPDVVRKVVLVSASYTFDGLHPGLRDGIDNLQPEQLAGSPFQLEYARTAPNPDDWPTLIEKIKQLDHELTDLPAADIRSIQAPALLVIGDSDIIRPEHAVEMFRLLGGGVMGDAVGLPRSRLAVLPGTTHITVMHRAESLSPMVSEFLDAPVPASQAEPAATTKGHER